MESKESEVEDLFQVYSKIKRSREIHDYIQLADLIEWHMVPALLQIQKFLVRNEMVFVDEMRLQRNLEALRKTCPALELELFGEYVSDDYQTLGALSDTSFERVIQVLQTIFQRGYVVEFTGDGQMTIAVPKDEHHYFLHTKELVFRESQSLAEEWLFADKETYLFYGFGLGYQYQWMLDTDENVKITVLEGNRHILALACVFSDLYQMLESKRFELVADFTNLRIFDMVTNLGENGACFIHAPSIQAIENEVFRTKIEEYFVLESSVRTQGHLLHGNYRRNIQLNLPEVSSLFPVWKGKDLYIIAAGPSLDTNMNELKKVDDKGIILATGTVLKKLLAAGIIPDYVIIIDANKVTHRQIEGIEGCGIPLLCLSTVNSEIPRDYQGEKYIILQKGLAEAEKLAVKEEYPLFETGGSVSTTALDLGYQAGCRRIIFVGLDLAYTSGKDHASQTDLFKTVHEQNTIMVEANDGTMVATGKNLNIYRKWIEKYLSSKKNGIEVINATEGGAKISGMRVMTLADAIQTR